MSNLDALTVVRCIRYKSETYFLRNASVQIWMRLVVYSARDKNKLFFTILLWCVLVEFIQELTGAYSISAFKS
jgi:hypothetical protein